jgi:F-type H+-transporting ATPase subunit b
MLGLALAATEKADKSDLIKPAPGLMIWTIVTFVIVFWVLKRYAFGRIAELLDQRRAAVQSNIEAAEHARDEAERLLDEYKQQLSEARKEATAILDRARHAGEEQKRALQDELAAEREKGIAQVQATVAAETRQALDRIKTEIAELTLAATEAVLKTKLDEAEQRRLIDEALAGVDFSTFERESA